jgi:5-methylcytosine-specific restriction endonuclease McrA
MRPGRSDCAVCHREREKGRYHRESDKQIAYASKWQREHRDHRSAYMKAYYVKNLEKMRAYSRYQARIRSVGRDNTDAHNWIAVLDGDPCAYCGAPMEHVDHITPLARGGTNDWFNLTAACQPCNSSKRDRPLLIFLLKKGIPA